LLEPIETSNAGIECHSCNWKCNTLRICLQLQVWWCDSYYVFVAVLRSQAHTAVKQCFGESVLHERVIMNVKIWKVFKCPVKSCYNSVFGITNAKCTEPYLEDLRTIHQSITPALIETVLIWQGTRGFKCE